MTYRSDTFTYHTMLSQYTYVHAFFFLSFFFLFFFSSSKISNLASRPITGSNRFEVVLSFLCTFALYFSSLCGAGPVSSLVFERASLTYIQLYKSEYYTCALASAFEYRWQLQSFAQWHCTVSWGAPNSQHVYTNCCTSASCKDHDFKRWYCT